MKMCMSKFKRKEESLELYLFLLVLNFTPCKISSMYKKLLRWEVLCSSVKKPKQTSRINHRMV